MSLVLTNLCNHSIQMLTLSQAIVLSFLNPVMASIAARVVLHEKLKITDIGGTETEPLALASDFGPFMTLFLFCFLFVLGLACSFFGVLFIFGPTLTVQGTEVS